MASQGILEHKKDDERDDPTTMKISARRRSSLTATPSRDLGFSILTMAAAGLAFERKKVDIRCLINGVRVRARRHVRRRNFARENLQTIFLVPIGPCQLLCDVF